MKRYINIEHLIIEAKRQGFNIGICAKIVDEKGRILLLQRSTEDYCPGVWEMPGGGVDKDEDLLTALKRELWEEAGIELSDTITPVDYFDFYNIETGKIKRKICYLLPMTGKVCLSNDHSAYQFFTIDEIKNLVVEGQSQPYQIFSDHFELLIR